MFIDTSLKINKKQWIATTDLFIYLSKLGITLIISTTVQKSVTNLQIIYIIISLLTLHIGMKNTTGIT